MFVVDIVINFMRVPENVPRDTVTHSMIAAIYTKNCNVYLDVLATIPLYLYDYWRYT
jgi:hypothetical protein